MKLRDQKQILQYITKKNLKGNGCINQKQFTFIWMQRRKREQKRVSILINRLLVKSLKVSEKLLQVEMIHEPFAKCAST